MEVLGKKVGISILVLHERTKQPHSSFRDLRAAQQKTKRRPLLRFLRNIERIVVNCSSSVHYSIKLYDFFRSALVISHSDCIFCFVYHILYCTTKPVEIGVGVSEDL